MPAAYPEMATDSNGIITEMVADSTKIITEMVINSTKIIIGEKICVVTGGNHSSSRRRANRMFLDNREKNATRTMLFLPTNEVLRQTGLVDFQIIVYHI